MRAGVAATNITVETQISADLLTDFSIDYTAIGEDIIPDTTNTRTLGSDASKWKNIKAILINAVKVDSNLTPLVDDTRTLGIVTAAWKEIFVNDIQGAARALIMMGI